MPDLKSREILNEKTLEIILNFKPNEKLSQLVISELLRLKENIRKIIGELPKEEKEILELRYFQNLQLDGIATSLGKPKEEINHILSRSIQKVKDTLRKRKLGLEEAKSIKEIKELKKTGKSQQAEVSTQVSPEAISFLIGFIIVLIFGGISLSGYFVLQKFVFKEMPTVSQVFSNLNFLAQEKISNNVTLIQETEKQKPSKEALLSREPYTIKVAGSTSLFALVRRWENSFSAEFPKHHIELVATDSTSGVRALIQGKVDVANSSRPVTYQDEELAANKGLELVEHRVGSDALIIIVNKKNPIEVLSLDDLKGIFSGEIKSWEPLSNGKGWGTAVPSIFPVVREQGSGTNDFAIDRILEGSDFPSEILTKKSNKEIIGFVSSDLGGVGFINSTNYPVGNNDVKYVKVKNYDNSLGFSPFEGNKLDEQALRYGDYPLTHYLYLVTLSGAPKKVDEFISWVLSKKGQEIVKYSGLITVNWEQ
jgi:phosphate transport system substrate-binding protein